MSLQAISTVEPKRKSPSMGISAAAGAAIGAGSRYLVPTKDEMKSVDTFVSSAAMNARGANRSILKYGAIGAIAAAGLNLLVKVFTPEHKENKNVEYTKLGALMDAPDYSCQFIWYGE